MSDLENILVNLCFKHDPKSVRDIYKLSLTLKHEHPQILSVTLSQAASVLSCYRASQ